MTPKPVVLFLTVIVVFVGACTPKVQYTTNEHRTFDLKVDNLKVDGVAFITPSSITGREQDRQSLALTFAEVLREKRPDIRVVSLPETLSAINQCGCLAEYRAMFDDYESTGVFKYEILKKVGEVTGTRYLAQLKLAGFNQGNTGRFGVLGLRVLETKKANLRVFLQLWDSHTGAIVWEGYEEMDYAYDTATEQGVMFHDIARAMAVDMFTMLPEPPITDTKEPEPQDPFPD